MTGDEDSFAVWDLEDDEIDDIIDDDGTHTPKKGKKNTGKDRKGRPKFKEGKSRSKTRPPSGNVTSTKAQRPLPKKGGGLIKNKAFIWSTRVGVVVSILLLLFLPLQPLEQFREDAGMNKLKNLLRPFREFPEWVEANMTIEYFLKIKGGTAKNTTIKTAIPFDIKDENGTFRIQDVMRVSLEPVPNVGMPSDEGKVNRVSGWTLLDERGDFHFKAQYTLNLYSYKWDIDEGDSGGIGDIPQEYKASYLDDEWIVTEEDGQVRDRDDDGEPDFYRYHPSAPRIKDAALRLTEDEPTVLGKVKAIYDWIEDHFNYTSNSQRERDQNIYGSWPKWPLGCLADWYGDCDDQSLLMASMCRAVGIPAWLEIGYLYDPVQRTWGGHGWFNVVIPLKGRGPIVAPIDPVNHEFLFRDPYRITDWIDTGGDVMNEDGEYVFNLDYYYNYFKVEKSGSVTVEPSTSTTNVMFEEHGKIRQYVDQKMKPGSLPGEQGGFSSLPFPGLALAPVAIIPFFLGRKRME